MADYESEIKHSPYNNDTVYAKLSDLATFDDLRLRMDQPGAADAMLAQMPEDQRDPEKVQKALDAIRKLIITSDTLTFPGSPIGDVTLAIIERDAPKCIKFELQDAPVKANLWVQLLPATDGGTRMKLTVRADLNFMMKAMLGSKLKQGVDGIATMLAQLPYGML
ncbi:MAG: SRPBCC family protein [Bacteroidaceae bacterium]|nr:SRPBCC family protein [Bacteroidaceae bacterium]